jgi:hypothetical protein
MNSIWNKLYRQTPCLKVMTNNISCDKIHKKRKDNSQSIGGVCKSFRTEKITKYMLTFGITPWEATQRVMAVKLTRLTHKMAIQLHLVAEICTICSSRSRRPFRKLLDTLVLRNEYQSQQEVRRLVVRALGDFGQGWQHTHSYICTRCIENHFFLKRHLQSSTDFWPTLMDFSIYI